MKYYLLLVVVLILSLKMLYSIEFNEYKIEVVHVFNASHFGNENGNDLGVNLNPGGGDARGPGLFFIDDQLVVSDQSRREKRTIYLDKNYNISNKYKSSFFKSTVYWYEDVVIGNRFNQYISIYKISPWQNIAWLQYFDLNFLSNFKDIYYQDKTIFIYDKNFKLWAIRNPGLDEDENRKNIIKEEDIIEEIKTGKYEGLTIDEKKRLFRGGELQTVNFKVFTEYYSEYQKKNNLIKPEVNFSMTIKDITTKSEKFLGKDDFGYTYWTSWNTDIAVFDNNGFLIELFVLDHSSTTPAISNSGDVFTLSYGTDKVTLYKIKRQW